MVHNNRITGLRSTIITSGRQPLPSTNSHFRSHQITPQIRVNSRQKNRRPSLRSRQSVSQTERDRRSKSSHRSFSLRTSPSRIDVEFLTKRMREMKCELASERRKNKAQQLELAKLKKKAGYERKYMSLKEDFTLLLKQF